MARTKREIYHELLLWCLPHLRNRLSNLRHDKSVFAALRGRKEIAVCHELAQLVHNIPTGLQNEECTDHDVWFINAQAKAFLENPSVPMYSIALRLVRELADLLPAPLREQITWEIPE